MDQTMTVVLIVAIVVVLAIALIVALSRRSRLRPLPPESRDRYARSWRGVETRFFDDPHGAVQEADKVVVGMLSERGATIHDDRQVPADLKRARAAATSDEGRQGTEGMSEAMEKPSPSRDGEMGFWPEMHEYRHRMTDIQSEFIEEPKAAVKKAEQLIEEAVDYMAKSVHERVQRMHYFFNDAATTEKLRLMMRNFSHLIDRLDGSRAA